MSHLLMIESWVGGTARILPQAIVAAGHRYTFVARRPEHYASGATGALEHPVLACASRILVAETNDTESLVHTLKLYHADDPFDGVLTICDYYLEQVVAVAGALAIPHPFPAGVGSERRKHVVRRALDQAGIANPRYAVTTTWEATRRATFDLGFPLVLKPSDLASSAHVQLVRNEAELEQAFTTLQSLQRNFRDQPRDAIYLLEEYVRGAEFSVETCTDAGSTTVLGVTDKSVTGEPYFIEDGHMFPAPLAPESSKRLEAFAVDVLRAVGHERGLAHIEVKLTAAGPRLIEINPRLPGNYIVELVRLVTGIDLLQVTLDLALGKAPSLRVEAGAVRSAAIKFLTPPRAGVLRAMRGLPDPRREPRLVRARFDLQPGAAIAAPIDNACYLGHVVAVDPDGMAARDIAEGALRSVEVVYEH